MKIIPASTLRLFLTALAFGSRTLPQPKVADAMVAHGFATVVGDVYAITAKGNERFNQIATECGKTRAEALAEWAAKIERAAQPA